MLEEMAVQSASAAQTAGQGDVKEMTEQGEGQQTSSASQVQVRPKEEGSTETHSLHLGT